MREPHHPSCAELELSSVLHALSDPGRLAIVEHLGSGCECACGCFSLGLSKPTLSHHLRVLREAGVTYTRCEGRQRLISLRREDLDARFPGLLDAVLAADHAPAASQPGLNTRQGPPAGMEVRPLGLEPRPPT